MDIFNMAATSSINNPLLPEWVEEVRLYCEKNGITPGDLIKAHKSQSEKKIYY